MGVPSPSGSLILGGAAHRYSEDESVDAKEVFLADGHYCCFPAQNIG